MTTETTYVLTADVTNIIGGNPEQDFVITVGLESVYGGSRRGAVGTDSIFVDTSAGIQTTDASGTCTFDLVPSEYIDGEQYVATISKDGIIYKTVSFYMPSNNAVLSHLPKRGGAPTPGSGNANDRVYERFTIHEYEVSATFPTLAGGGTFEITTGIQTPTPGTSSSPSTPGSGQKLYTRDAVIDTRFDAGTLDLSDRWSSWYEAGTIGPQGLPGQNAEVQFRSADPNSEWHDDYLTNDEYRRFWLPELNKWTTAIPLQGKTGTAGRNGN